MSKEKPRRPVEGLEEEMNNEIFDKAVEIAHGDFWLADTPQVAEAAKRIIERRKCPPDDGNLLARYVAIICHCAVQEELGFLSGEGKESCTHDMIANDADGPYCERCGKRIK